MTHKNYQNAAAEAYERKHRRFRPEFLNQDTVDRVASDHAKELIELGAKSVASSRSAGKRRILNSFCSHESLNKRPLWQKCHL